MNIGLVLSVVAPVIHGPVYAPGNEDEQERDSEYFFDGRHRSTSQ
jgi:hypothetical protein